MSKKIKGEVQYNFVKKDGTKYGFGKFPNMRVDDGTEYLLDFFAGIATWHNYSSNRATYGTGQTELWDKRRWVGLGTCMFNNSSEERVSGLQGIPSGNTSYTIADTDLVSVEDSTLSNEVGSRVQATPDRTDQTAELYALFDVPGDIPSGTEIREFGLFLSDSGPNHDPSNHDQCKPKAMLCRSVRYGTGMIGGTGYYTDDPLIANDDIQIRWKVGEV